MGKWEMVKIKDVAVVQSGGTPKRNVPEFWKNGHIPWVKISDIRGPRINTTEEHITSEGLNNSSAKIFPKGTILYTIFATLGEVATLEIDATTNQAIAGINVDLKRIEPRFLVSYLTSIKTKVINAGRGVAQNNINLSILRELLVPLPVLSVQRKIADVLDSAAGLIEKRKAQIEKLDLLANSLFIEMFGDPVINTMRWKTMTLGELTDILSSKRIFENEYTSEGIPFYRTKEIVELSKGLPITKTLYISKQRYQNIKQIYDVPSTNDLLISAVGTIGVIWIVDGSNEFYFKDGNLLWVKQPRIANSIFLKNILEKILLHYSTYIPSGTAYNALTIEKLKKLIIPIPDYGLQNKFATHVQDILNKKIHIQKSLVKLNMLYNSLIQKCFRGEIF